MKKLKFLLFAVAMLLTVCVQAENKPETVANVNPQPVVTMVSPETADVQQVPCILVIVSTRCGWEHNFAIMLNSSGDCDRLESFVYTIMDLSGC